MGFDITNLFTVLVEGFSFVAAIAAIAASFIMFSVTKKFGSGILASGFNSIAIGVIFIAFGIIIHALTSYVPLPSLDNIYVTLLFMFQGLCFVIGTYIIVIGSKRTADKLESLTK